MRPGPVHRPGTRARWTTSNVDEGLPGVLTPLTWSFYWPATETAARGAWHALGATTRAERDLPDDVDDRFFTAVLGHAAANVDLFSAMAGRMPGGSAAAMEEQFFGSVQDPRPAELRGWERRRRHPAIAARAPLALGRAVRDLTPRARDTDAWWRARTGPGAPPVGRDGRAVLLEARRRFGGILATHLVLSMVGQGLVERVAAVARDAGLPGLERELVKSDRGTAEFELVRDLWALAGDRIGLDDLLLRHGYHGAGEGLLEARSWREDPAPVRRLAEAYRRREAEDVDALVRRRREEHARAVDRLRGAIGPRRSRPALALVRFAGRVPGWRETGRASILRAVDVARAAARATGRELATAGALDDPEDVFLLTIDEIAGGRAAGFRDLVADRCREHEAFARVRLPQVWRGEPRVTAPGGGDRASCVPAAPRAPASAPGAADPPAAVAGTTVTGIGVGTGVAEGVVAVVHDQDEADLDDDAVLVCRTTDPGWASLFPLVRAVVTDVGSTMSHAAIVCRELGLPCVANTRTGTAVLRDGMRVRVDGGAGTVEILAGPAAR